MKFGDFFKTIITTSAIVGSKGLWGVNPSKTKHVDSVFGLDEELDSKNNNVNKIIDEQESKKASLAAASGFIKPSKDSYPSSNLWQMREIELSKEDDQLLSR